MPANAEDEIRDSDAESSSGEEMVEGEDGEIDDVIEQLEKMAKLEQEIKARNKEKKVFTDMKKQIYDGMVSFFQKNDFPMIKIKDDTTDDVVYVEERETNGSLTRPKLLQALKNYFDIDEKHVQSPAAYNAAPDEVRKNIDEAQRLYDFLDSAPGKSSKCVLVRESANKKKKRKRPTAPLTIVKPEPEETKKE